ncbi:MAG: HIT domain-containing protein [Candidatus Cloacimonetes bacterium]|nr:HIT domain-containing protein [Candidatus Cloacimonadota bacterium]
MSREYLYSPWRMEYILGEKPTDCVMCRANSLKDDEGNLILYRATYCYVMLNRYPYNNGHLMVVPYVHESCLSKLDKAIWQEMNEITRICEQALRRVYHPDGVNIGMNLGEAAGAGIAEHLHLHLVPRWHGDSNFMHVVSGQRVIPEPFETSFSKLKKTINEVVQSHA